MVILFDNPDFNTFCRNLPGDLFSIKRLIYIKEYYLKEFRKKVEKHRKSHDPDNPRDFIDTYITKMNEEQKVNPNSTFSGSGFKPRLKHV